MMMPNRTFSSGSYRYGFNGKENDNEVKGEGNTITYENRIYDPRTGRWYSLDPLQKKYPNESNYIFTGDSPILFADKDGRDRIVTITTIGKDGYITQIRKIYKNDFYYNEEYGSNGGTHYYKSNMIQNVTYDLRSGTVTNTSFINNTKEIPGVEYVFRGLTLSGDQSGEIAYGYRIYGNGKDMGWQSGLPTAAPGSESLDLGTWLDFVGGLREGASPLDLLENYGGSKKLGSFLEKMDKIKEAFAKTADAVEGIGAIKDNKQKPTKAKPLYEGIKPRTIVHKRGDPPGFNRTVINDNAGSVEFNKPATDTVPKR